MINSIYSRHARTFRQFYNNNKKINTFIIKLVNLPPDNVEDHFRIILKPLGLQSLKMINEYYLHENMFEFPQIPFGKVYVYRIEILGSITIEDLNVMIYESLGISMRYMEIMRENDPLYQMKKQKEEHQPEAKEAPNPDDYTYKDSLFTSEGIKEYVARLKKMRNPE